MAARILRFLLAVAALPLCAALGVAFLDAMYSLAGSGDTLFSVEAIAFAGGFAAFLAAWAALPRPTRTYVLGHELTHAVWGLMFGARVSRLRVSESGGSVNVTKSNVLITLAPYFFPFYTILVVIAALVTGIFFKPLPWTPLWLAAVGFTWCFHVCFTLQALGQRQPDVQEYGRLFSWTFIWIANLVGVFAWLCAVTPLTFRGAADMVSKRTVSFYASTGSAINESVRALPFLQK